MPEQPGEPKTPFHRLGFPLGLFFLCAGLGCLRHYLRAHENNSDAKLGFLICLPLGTLLSLSSVYLEWRYRAGKLSEKYVMPIRTRLLVLFGGIAGYGVILVLIVHFLGPALWWAMPLLWVAGAGLIGNAVAAYYRRHPPHA